MRKSHNPWSRITTMPWSQKTADDSEFTDVHWAQMTGGEGSSRIRPEFVDTFDWISLRRDVLILGDAGAGKSFLLHRVAVEARERSWRSIVLQGSALHRASQLAAFRFHPLARQWKSGTQTGEELFAIFREELAESRPLLIIDGLSELDDESLALVDRLLTSTQATLVATARLKNRHRLAPRYAEPDVSQASASLLATRAPAIVEVKPLSFVAMADLVRRRLSGSSSTGLVSQLLAVSRGNPRVAEIVLDAAQWSGTIQQINGIWSAATDLLSAPLSALTHSLTHELDSVAIDLLEQVAVAAQGDGKMPDRRSVERLLSSGHLVAGPSGELDVAPPALGAALRQRRLQTDSVTVAEEIARAAESRSIAEVANARCAWEEGGSLRDSVNYLLALADLGDRRTMHEVFAQTQPDTLDHPDDVGLFATIAAEWAQTTERPAWTPDTAPKIDQPTALALDLRALLDAGWANKALELTDAPFSHRDRGLVSLGRMEALVLLDRLTEAEDWAESQLQAAVQEGSAAQIQALSYGLAYARWSAGHSANSWPPLSLALRLVKCGPLDLSTAKSLVLACHIQNQIGRHDLARMFGDDVRSFCGSGAVAAELRAIVDAVAPASPISSDDADELLWQAGMEQLETGRVVAAVQLWLLMGDGLDSARARKVVAIAESVDAPMIGRLATVREHIASGDRQRTTATDRPQPLPASLRKRIVQPTDSAAQHMATSEPPASARCDLRPTLDIVLVAGGLTAREREVADLAQLGTSNKEIARHLGISVRTVENHMRGVLGKLGLSSRTQLAMRR